MDFNDDWYTYLNEDFKLHRKAYKSKSRGVFHCPVCDKSLDMRVDHVKVKIKKIGYFKCCHCSRVEALKKARHQKAIRSKAN